MWRCQNELKSLSACLRHLARRAFQMGERENAGVFAKLPSSLPPCWAVGKVLCILKLCTNDYLHIMLSFFSPLFHLFILISNCTLPVCRNTTDFWMLTFDPVTLPNSCISFRSSFVDSLGFLHSCRQSPHLWIGTVLCFPHSILNSCFSSGQK